MVSAGAYGAMFGRRWWKNRFRIQAGQVVGLIERGLNPVLVDARGQSDFETSPLRLPGAIRLSPEDAAAGRIPLDGGPEAKQQMIVVYCTSHAEKTSEQVASILRAGGFKAVRILTGGLGGWANARLPVETKGHLPAVGLEIYKNLAVADLERRRVPAGTTIFREGDDAQGEAFLIHAGTVGIRKRRDGSERDLGTMGDGQLLGQMALFRKAPRSASALAVTDVELLVIRSERLEWLMRNRPQVAIEIVKDLSDLVVRTDPERETPPGA
jgi:rhodanese-related sulfurtransferase